MSFNLSKFIRVFVPLAAFAILTSNCCAWWGQCGYILDGHTRYMWARTWYGPNDLAKPLSQYYVPRTPGSCGSGGFGESSEPAGGGGQYGSVPYSANAAAGFEPVKFERLGRVPNEMDLGGNLALPPGGPAPSRRP
jgi:hypothetical protein